jgi:hypothetical protein
MKIYKLCESSTGYVWNFIVYNVKDTIYDQRHPGEQTSSRTVLEVTHNLPDKGYCLYLDNCYTKLVDTLSSRKTDVAGTMRTNRRDFPNFVKRDQTQKGKTVAALCKKQVIKKWKDKSKVILISTFHDDSMVDVTTRKRVIQKPYVVLDDKNTGEVDRNDGQLQRYKLARECLKKYYQKMYHYLLDLVCLNPFIICKKGGSISRLDFLLTLAKNLSSSGKWWSLQLGVTHQNHLNLLDTLDAASQTRC